MEPQLLFFDIDGTLLSSHTYRIPETAVDAILKAQANGHLVFINTGRTIGTLPDEIKNIPFDGFLCGCGTRIVYHDQTLLAHSFTMEQGIELINLMEEHDLEVFLEGTDDIYCKRGDYRQPELNKLRESFCRLGFCKSSVIDERNFTFDKFIIISDNQAQTDRFIQTVSHEIEAIDRGSGMYECIPRGYSKATAMQTLANHLNIPMSHTWAFGDSSNDLAMIQAAAHGIAMGEHSPVLDPYVEIIADTVENDGIARVLHQAGLI